MSWRCVEGYAVGTSHQSTETPCQDRCASTVFLAEDGGEVMACAVSDGAGSAGRAEQGAQIVCDTLLACARETLTQSSDLDAVSDEIIRSWFLQAREQIRAQAGDDDAMVRDYAATGLLAVASAYQTLCAQIGDGAIVIRKCEGPGFEVAIWPEGAEYANETFFVTDPASAEHVQIARYDKVCDVVAFSDGLQRLALDQVEHAAYTRFFTPLVGTIRSSNDTDLLETQLVAYLNSKPINERTDDDKSLAIACRLDGC